MQYWPVNILVENFCDRYRKVTANERKENHENHPRYPPLVSFLFRVSLIFQLCRFGCLKSVSTANISCIGNIVIASLYFGGCRNLSLVVWHSILCICVSSHSLFRSAKKKKIKQHEVKKFTKFLTLERPRISERNTR